MSILGIMRKVAIPIWEYNFARIYMRHNITGCDFAPDTQLVDDSVAKSYSLDMGQDFPNDTRGSSTELVK